MIEAARSFLGRNNDEILSSRLQDNLDWEILLDFLSDHGCTPLFAKSTIPKYESFIPPTHLDSINKYTQASSLRNQLIESTLIELLLLLYSNDIPCVPLKGPILSNSLYDDTYFREYADLDLLVKKTDLEKAGELIENQGFKLKFNVPKRLESYYIESGFYLLEQDIHLSYVRDTDNQSIDLHWSLVPERYSFSPLMLSVWNRSIPAKYKDSNFMNLSVEDLFIFLCIHGAKHSWSQLNWIIDLAQLLNISPNLDWGWIKKECVSRNCTTMINTALLLLYDLFDFNIPESLSDEFNRNSKSENLTKLVYKTLNSPESYDKNLTAGRFYVYSMDSVLDKSHYYRDLVFKPTTADLEALKLPPYLFFLYSPLRPFRLFVKHTGKLFSGSSQDN